MSFKGSGFALEGFGLIGWCLGIPEDLKASKAILCDLVTLEKG